MRRVIWILITPAILLLTIGLFIDQWIAPRALAFLMEKVETISKEQGPFEVKMQSAELQYFPPGLVAQNIKLTPKKKIAPYLSDIQIQNAKGELALFALLTGKLKIGLIDIDSPTAQVNISLDSEISKQEKFSLRLNWDPLFQHLQNIPIEQIQIRNLNLNVFDRKSQATVQLYPTELQVLQLRNLLQAKLTIPNLVASWDKKERVKTELNAVAVITPKSLRIQKFEIKNTTLDFNLSGEMKTKKKGQLETQVLWTGFLNLDQVRDTLKQVFPSKAFPHFSGELRANGSWRPTQSELLLADFNLETKNVKVADFAVGDASVKGSLEGTQINLENLKVEHPAGNIELHNTKLGLDSNLPLSSKLNLKQLNLQKLFQSLNLKRIPVEAHLQGLAPCQGQLRPLEFKCEFNAELNNLHVRSSYPQDSFEIVHINSALANGHVQVNMSAVNFDGDIKIGDSTGTTKGHVEYAKGFDIQYSASKLHWEDIANLAKLNLKGTTELSGETKGDSHKATFKMKTKSSQHSLDGFYLGDNQFELSYNQGKLHFPSLAGQIEKTQYQGKLVLDLRESTLEGDIHSNNARLEDIRKLLMDRIPIPIPLEGPGQIQVKAKGPLNFWGLNTEVKGRFNQPLIGTEIFNNLQIDIKSKDGLYQLQKVEARRGATILATEGTLSPQKELNLTGSLRNALLEESDMISKIGWPLSGKLNAEMKLNGTLDNPLLHVSGQFSDMILDENDVANSNFKFEIEDHHAALEGAFFGHQVQTNIEWPVSPESKTDTLVRLKTQDWDYSPWLSLFNAGAINEETRGNLSCDVNLSSQAGRWDQLTGHFKIQNFLIARHDLVLENTQPITIKADNGYYSFHNFLLKSGQKGKVEIAGQNVHPNKLNLQVNASSDLKLAQIFIPFFDEISGLIDFNASIQGAWNYPQLIGQMNIGNGYLRVKDFPHAFEKMKIDATFSQSRVLFNDIQGQLGGGSLKGEGSLQIQGPEDIPVLIRVKARDISLNVPNQVKTKGDADITFSGRWFPYLLGGTYRINSTMIEMNFGGTQLANQMKQNYYLPQSLKEKIVSPLDLDLHLQFEKPLQIKNNLMEAQATGSLNIKGSPVQPVLIGQLKALKGSQLFFKDKPFDIQAASIQFQNPAEINPDLFITAQTRIEEYDVSLLVQGSAKDPNIRLTSTPPLSENDLTSLLALGVTSSKLQTVQSKEQQNQTANEVFAAAFQSTGFTKKVQSATGFNVQLSNSFDTTRNISVPKFTISRKLNKKTKASVAFPVTGDQKTPEGRIQYNIDENISINGSYETKKFDQSTTNIDVRETPSILGVDLEYKREFR